MTTISPEPATSECAPDHRANLISDLREMATWLENHPDATIARHTTAHIQYSVDVSTPPGERREVVTDIGGDLGLPVLERDGQVYVQYDIGQARYVAASTKPDARRTPAAVQA